MEYGIQMYSVRDLTKDNLDEALRQVAALGYKMVEFAGFFGHSAQEVKAMLDKYGLRVSGTHTGWQEVAEHFDETVAFHKIIGNTNIIVPGADLSDQKKLDAFVEMANEFQPKLAKEGISFGYHNHAHEFRPNEDGSMIHDQIVYRTNLNIEIVPAEGQVPTAKINGNSIELTENDGTYTGSFQMPAQVSVLELNSGSNGGNGDDDTGEND